MITDDKIISDEIHDLEQGDWVIFNKILYHQVILVSRRSFYTSQGERLFGGNGRVFSNRRRVVSVHQHYVKLTNGQFYYRALLLKEGVDYIK